MPISLDLTGRVALVTGGGSGLGRAAAERLAAAGATVVVAGRREDVLRQAAAAMDGDWIACDVADTASVGTLFDTLAARHARLDILVNAAGLNIRNAALDVAEPEWDLVNGVNAKGTFFCCQAAARLMKANGHGKIVNIGSMASEIGIPNASVYCASKGAVRQITMALAAEWAPYGIRVNAIMPGWFRTELTERLFADEAWRTRVLARIPLGRPGQPSEVADLALFLASPLSDYLTGETIRLDGGALAW
ncbi:SDR family NAD(P)-dependent oxidoreductase [Azospirillum melinis]|uniref:SDR family NAD(P)-dependent oxidoreductase n=1 Tax=Azospirillum melinis TaxID=328839 RepID=UPI0037573C93